MKEGKGLRVHTLKRWTMEDVEKRCTPYGECLLWNLSLNSGGHAVAHIGGQSWLVRRYVFTQLMGRRLRDGELLTVRCQESRCMAPACLVTSNASRILKRAYADIMKDETQMRKRQRFATNVGFAKLNHETAQSIRARGLTLKEVMAEYGLSDTSARQILSGKSWRAPRVANSVFALAESMGVANG
jgi:hypothetical protein